MPNTKFLTGTLLRRRQSLTVVSKIRVSVRFCPPQHHLIQTVELQSLIYYAHLDFNGMRCILYTHSVGSMFCYFLSTVTTEAELSPRQAHTPYTIYWSRKWHATN